MNVFCPECGQLSMHADPTWFGLFLHGVKVLGHNDGGPSTPCWDCYLIANPILPIPEISEEDSDWDSFFGSLS